MAAAWGESVSVSLRISNLDGRLVVEVEVEMVVGVDGVFGGVGGEIKAMVVMSPKYSNVFRGAL